MARREKGTGGGRRAGRVTLALGAALLITFVLGVVAAKPIGRLVTALRDSEPAPRPPERPDRRAPSYRPPPGAGRPVAPPPGVDPNATETRFEDFTSDPKWEGERNRWPPDSCPVVRQDFGWRTSATAGATPGEVGGTVSRTLQPAYYAMPLESRRGLDDRFSMEGTLNVAKLSSSGSSGILLGLFNHRAEDWRTPSSLAVRIFDSRGSRGKVNMAAEYGTREYRTGQLAVGRDGGVQDPDAKEVVPFDLDRSRRFRFDYDPDGAGGRGQIRLAVEGASQPVVLDLKPGHRLDGADFDRFGILNQQQEVGGSMEAYFGDLRMNGRPVRTEAAAGWQGRGNERRFRDCQVETRHDFGFSPRLESIGGLIWRTDNDQSDDLRAWYGDGKKVSLGLDDELYASGRIRLAQASSDSGVYLAWFGEDGKAGDGGGPQHVPTDLLGFMVEGPSEVGWYARPAYGSDSKDDWGWIRGEPGTPTIHPAAWHEFTLHYDPDAGEAGEIVLRLDGRESRLAVSEKAREEGAKLDHFGIRNVEDDGHSMKPQFDDLTYTYGSGKGGD